MAKDNNDLLREGGEKAVANNLLAAILDANENLDAEIKATDSAVEQEKEKIYVFEKISGTSDLDNARRIAYLQRDKLKYLSDVGRFTFYDATTHIWKVGINQDASVYPLVVDTQEKLSTLASSKEQKDIAAVFTKHKKISPAVAMLKGVRDIILTRADFDTHKNLLNCRNCAVDLETGKIYEVAAELSNFRFTQCTNANYNPKWRENPVAVVDKFLTAILPNEEILNFFISWLGYCLTAQVNEEKFVLMKGTGGNGKGTLTNTLLSAGGNYFVPFPVSALLLKSKIDADAATPTLNRLEKARLAIGEEIPPNAKVDPAQLKLLTGGDRFYARNLHEEGREVEPTAKLMLSGNNDLIFPDAKDYAIARRLIAVNFEQSFREKPNVHLKQQLLEPSAQDYFLSKLIGAAKSWFQNGGLHIPATLQAASKDYLAEQDFLAEFNSEYCEFYSDGTIKRQDYINKLREEYPRETGGLSQKTLTEMLKRIDGVKYEKRGGVWKLIGIAKNRNWQD